MNVKISRKISLENYYEKQKPKRNRNFYSSFLTIQFHDNDDDNNYDNNNHLIS